MTPPASVKFACARDRSGNLLWLQRTDLLPTTRSQR